MAERLELEGGVVGDAALEPRREHEGHAHVGGSDEFRTLLQVDVGKVVAGIDFTTGMVANQDYQLWDYRALPFNFMGQMVLQNSMVYSIAATLIVWVFYPLLDTALHRMPRGGANALALGLGGVYLFLVALHFFVPATLLGG